MRIVPSLDGLINEEWITNKTRFSMTLWLYKEYIRPKYLFTVNLLSLVELSL
jgi:hypothetical protein